MTPILIDTHVLLWAAAGHDRIPANLLKRLLDEKVQPMFSSASIWEVVIKNALGREDFKVDPTLLRRGLLENGYQELPISSVHALAVGKLPNLHRDPFDRILVAQANEEGFELLTVDQTLAAYPGPITFVG
jgi:PIN domain nuclease of toxin-antitoxin system